MLRTFAAALILALPLAACDSGGDGTTISINASGTDGNMVAGVDKDGQVSVNVPGFSGKLKLPKMKLDAGDFDLNGVKLYPGSTISAMNVDAKDGGKGGTDSGRVRISFDSPGTPKAVQDWFLQRLNKDAGFKVKVDGTGLTGTTEKDKPFKLELAPVGADHAKGTILLSD
ncbi:MAG: hypothetical protein V4564_15765 [Pseudomonadota bacterium]|uniref:hypothetical protein n=1 Tax=Sphingomonas sp. ERG5 TaxID=1381597 RepID=UPI00054C3947|nr:hypothetical protein [Sphingomonas sp. ERG5]